MAWWDEFVNNDYWNERSTIPYDFNTFQFPDDWWTNFDWQGLESLYTPSYMPLGSYENMGLEGLNAEAWLPGDFSAPSADPFATQASDFTLPEWEAPTSPWGQPSQPDAFADPLAGLPGTWGPPPGSGLTDLLGTGTMPLEALPNDLAIPDVLGTGTATPEMLGTASTRLLEDEPSVPRGLVEEPREPTIMEKWLQSQIDRNNRPERGSGIWGSGIMGSDVLGTAGLLTKLLSGDPKMDPTQRALLEAQIERTKAEAEKLRQPEPARGGGGGGFAPPSPGGASNIAAFSRALGLPTGGLNTLFSQTQGRLTSLIREKYDRQRAQVQEQANRMGTNPAGLLAQINKAEQEEMAGIVGQSQSALSPYLEVFARLFGIPLPGSEPRYQQPSILGG